jgi:hypothetical protein
VSATAASRRVFGFLILVSLSVSFGGIGFGEKLTHYDWRLDIMIWVFGFDPLLLLLLVLLVLICISALLLGSHSLEYPSLLYHGSRLHATCP